MFFIFLSLLETILLCHGIGKFVENKNKNPSHTFCEANAELSARYIKKDKKLQAISMKISLQMLDKS